MEQGFYRFSEAAKKLNRELVAIVVVGVVAAGFLIFLNLPKIDFSPTSEPESYERWNTSGPFAFNKFEYKIGENIFLSVHGLMPNEEGRIQVIPPNEKKIFRSIPFNGSLKSDFNHYFKPTTNRPLQICTVDDLIGNWTVVFEGVPYPPIRFEIIDEWIPGAEAEIEKNLC